MRKDFGQTGPRKTTRVVPEAGHSHYCDQCRAFVLQSIEIKKIAERPALTMTCTRCGSIEVFRHAVGGWLPEEIETTLTDFVATMIADKSVEIDERDAAAVEEKRVQRLAQEQEEKEAQDRETRRTSRLTTLARRLFVVNVGLGLVVSWMAVFAGVYYGVGGVGVASLLFLIERKREAGLSETEDDAEFVPVPVETPVELISETPAWLTHALQPEDPTPTKRRLRDRLLRRDKED